MGFWAARSFQAPGVLQGGPALLRLAVHGGGFERTTRQTSAGCFVQALVAWRFFDLGLHHLAICTHQEAQADGAFFFQAARGAGVLGFFAIGGVDHSGCAHGFSFDDRCWWRWRCRWCNGLRRCRHGGDRIGCWRCVGYGHIHRWHVGRRGRQVLGRRWWRRWRNIGFCVFEQNCFHGPLDLFDKSAGQTRADGPKEQKVQHHHQPQPNQVLGRLALPAGVINHGQKSPFQQSNDV